ncbi:hypothetical protein [Methylocapsa sp. S129]|uniref:hypothetical protein n=1 Tax=Methylocapsa sp. S129 TaxID=1641869 RepID=UPI00131B9ABD|nr:hypothetical protein [Methylocapsa sp. S129]
MTNSSISVGAAIAAALERGEQLRKGSARKPRVRIMTVFGYDQSGLTVSARIAARTNEELMAQQNLGARRIPWADLDGRAAELVTLVDEVVSEVETAVKNAAPPPGRPSRTESDMDLAAYEAVKDASYEALTRSAMVSLQNADTKRLSVGAASEATMIAALKLAALAALSGRIAPDDVQEELRIALSDIRAKAGEGTSPLMRRRLDS